jgi:hypothetical protein
MSKLAFAVSAMLFSNMASAQENASNPLAAVSNIDFRFQHFSATAGNNQDYFIDGAQMLMPKLKLKYELHYNTNNFTGSHEGGFEKLVVKPLYFPYQTKLHGPWAMKLAVGLDWIVDLGDTSKAIGVGADQIAPFGGAAFSNSSSGLVLIPLVQHFISYNGPDISTTSARLIAIQPFGEGYWIKGDVKVPYDWVMQTWPVTAEVQVGYNFNKSVAVYADGLFGIGGQRPYDWGTGVGLRFNY